MNIICQKGVWEEREDERKEFYFPVSTHYLEFLPHRSIHSSVFAKTKTSGYLSLGERGVGNWPQALMIWAHFEYFFFKNDTYNPFEGFGDKR